MKSMYGLPAEIQYCKNCVISNQRPRSTVWFETWIQPNGHQTAMKTP